MEAVTEMVEAMVVMTTMAARIAMLKVLMASSGLVDVVMWMVAVMTVMEEMGMLAERRVLRTPVTGPPRIQESVRPGHSNSLKTHPLFKVTQVAGSGPS